MTNLNQATVLSMVSELEVLIANRENGGKVKSLNAYLAPVQRAFINGLLEAPWSRPELNKSNLLKVIVAQLDASKANEIPACMVLFAEMTFKRFLPRLLRLLADGYPENHKSKILLLADDCESRGSISSLRAAAVLIEETNNELDWDSEDGEEWTEVRYSDSLATDLSSLSDLLAAHLNYLSNYACVKPLSFARRLALLAVCAGEEFGYEILNQYVEDLLQILMGCQYPGVEYLNALEPEISSSAVDNRSILLTQVKKMADQLGETEACEFGNVMQGIMLGHPIGAVLITSTGVESTQLDPVKVHDELSFAQITPVEYKLRFCIDSTAERVFVSFVDLSSACGMAASWRIGLDGVLEVIDYVLTGSTRVAVESAAK